MEQNKTKHSAYFTMITSSNGTIFRVTGLLCGEFTSHWWSPRTKASNAELWCFLWSAPEWTIARLVIWDAIAPIMTSQEWQQTIYKKLYWLSFCHNLPAQIGWRVSTLVKMLIPARSECEHVSTTALTHCLTSPTKLKYSIICINPLFA